MIGQPFLDEQVSCSFTVFAIDGEDVGDRLGVSVTILLTFGVFQGMVDEVHCVYMLMMQTLFARICA